MSKGLFIPKACGGVMHAHTVTTAQKYVVDWEKLERNIPIIRGDGNRSEQWDHLVNEVMGPQGTKDPELWDYIQRFRRKTRFGRRVVKDKMMTTAFVDFIVDQLQTETAAFGDFKFHDSGTGTVAEAITDTALGTPTGEARDTGTQTETDHNTYKSVATDTYAGTFAITEHGLFNIATAGVLMDRTVFAAINVVNGNQIEFTFEGSFAAGG